MYFMIFFVLNRVRLTPGLTYTQILVESPPPGFSYSLRKCLSINGKIKTLIDSYPSSNFLVTSNTGSIQQFLPAICTISALFQKEHLSTKVFLQRGCTFRFAKALISPTCRVIERHVCPEARVASSCQRQRALQFDFS